MEELALIIVKCSENYNKKLCLFPDGFKSVLSIEQSWLSNNCYNVQQEFSHLANVIKEASIQSNAMLR